MIRTFLDLSQCILNIFGVPPPLQTALAFERLDTLRGELENLNALIVNNPSKLKVVEMKSAIAAIDNTLSTKDLRKDKLLGLLNSLLESLETRIIDKTMELSAAEEEVEKMMLTVLDVLPSISKKATPALQPTELSNEEWPECVACMKDFASAMMIPCRHVAACVSCAKQFSRCMMCTAPPTVLSMCKLVLPEQSNGSVYRPKCAGIFCSRLADRCFAPCGHVLFCKDCQPFSCTAAGCGSTASYQLIFST